MKPKLHNIITNDQVFGNPNSHVLMNGSRVMSTSASKVQILKKGPSQGQFQEAILQIGAGQITHLNNEGSQPPISQERNHPNGVLKERSLSHENQLRQSVNLIEGQSPPNLTNQQLLEQANNRHHEYIFNVSNHQHYLNHNSSTNQLSNTINYKNQSHLLNKLNNADGKSPTMLISNYKIMDKRNSSGLKFYPMSSASITNSPNGRASKANTTLDLTQQLPKIHSKIKMSGGSNFNKFLPPSSSTIKPLKHKTLHNLGLNHSKDSINYNNTQTQLKSFVNNQLNQSSSSIKNNNIQSLQNQQNDQFNLANSNNNSQINYNTQTITNQPGLLINNKNSQSQNLSQANLSQKNLKNIMKLADESIAAIEKDQKLSQNPLNQSLTQLPIQHQLTRQSVNQRIIQESINSKEGNIPTQNNPNKNTNPIKKDSQSSFDLIGSKINNNQQQNQQQNYQQPMTNQNFQNVAFSNSFNTSLVLQQAPSQQQVLNQNEISQLLQKLEYSFTQQNSITSLKSSDLYQALKQILADLKPLIFVKDFQQIINMTREMLELLYQCMQEKKKKHKYLNRELQESTNKVKDALSRMENQTFKMKVEIESLKLDRKHFEEKTIDWEVKYEQLRLEKRDFERKFQQALSDLDHEKEGRREDNLFYSQEQARLQNQLKLLQQEQVEQKQQQQQQMIISDEKLQELKAIAQQSGVQILHDENGNLQFNDISGINLTASVIGGVSSDNLLLQPNQAQNLISQSLFQSQSCNCRQEKDEMQAQIMKLQEQINSLNLDNANIVESLEYARNKENKLMYLVFKLHKQGFPVNDIYANEVKPISTRRFNNEMMEKGGEFNDPNSAMNNGGLMTPDMRGESFISFDSQGSYEDLGLQKVQIKRKPDVIPSLNFQGLPEYVSSDDEDEKNQQKQQFQYQQKQQLHQQNDMYFAAMHGNANKHKSF
eukprot:403341463